MSKPNRHQKPPGAFRWFDLHHWVGLKLSILMSFILITGTFAVVSHEIDWLAKPALRVLPVHAAPDQDWQGLWDSARAARPDWNFSWISAPIDPWFAAEAVGVTPSGALRRLYIHPGTLAVQGEGSWINAQRVLRDSHRRLMIPHRLGIIVVSLLAIPLLLSLISGLFVYKKFWRGFFRKPRNRDSRTLWGDLHRLGGVWSLWLILVIGLTSLWYLVEAVGQMTGMTVAPYPQRDISASAIAMPDTQAPDLNDMARHIRAQAPDFEIEVVYPPKFADDPIRFSGSNQAILTRPRANVFSFDGQTGQALSRIEGTDLSAIQRLSELADPLHFGNFAGWISKLVYFVFGVILSGLSLSGIYVFSARIRRRGIAAPSHRTAPTRLAGAAQ
ncbi:MAG: PepSY domain-containing protein [Sphingomonadales bacterium]